jgi:hypothetical protein
MTPLRAVKTSMVVGVVLLVLSCGGGPAGFADDSYLSDNSERADAQTSRAEHDRADTRSEDAATERAVDATQEAEMWDDMSTEAALEGN